MSLYGECGDKMQRIAGSRLLGFSSFYDEMFFYQPFFLNLAVLVAAELH
jgi:hypothetical protein